jgi:hypothetical protein
MSRDNALQAYLTRIGEIQGQMEANATGPKIWSASAKFLGRMKHRLSRPPRIAIVGEANTGKTSVANLLLGQELLITDIVNNTRAPILIRYAERTTLAAIQIGGIRRPLSHDNLKSLRQGAFVSLEIGLPLGALKRFEIIDTPGVTMLGEDSNRLAFVCRQADMAIWCTLATQAWRATERELWNGVGERTRLSSLLAVTHADALTSVEQARVSERLQREAKSMFADIGMLTPITAQSSAGRPDGIAAANDLERAFQGKLDAVLEQIEQRRLMGAKRAVHRFIDRLGTPIAGLPVGAMRFAS